MENRVCMNRIRLLPEQVANQIAAGEVIERPASVVKELVENSLDAGANQIQVEIQAGGRALIRVTDDGLGMGRDDALLCLERHATSKIRLAEDLGSISTMGFRGEALPSIASVSRMSLVTRERDDHTGEGVQVVIHGGKILEVKAAGCAPGTRVEIRQIFFNLPARRKFLRSEETERAHVHHYMLLAALANPRVAFTFVDEQRTVWQLPAVAANLGPEHDLAALRERLQSLYPPGLNLLPVDVSDEIKGTADPLSAEADTSEPLRIWGFIGAPGVSRSTREDQHLFVNRRPVENRGLNFALLEGYHTALMKGRYPVCVLFLELSPASVDVNIHPSKREVKFHREREVRRGVAGAIHQTLVRFHHPPPAIALSPAFAPSEEGEGREPRPIAPADEPAPVSEVTPTIEHSTPDSPAAPPPAPVNPLHPIANWPARAAAGSIVRPEPSPERPLARDFAPEPVSDVEPGFFPSLAAGMAKPVPLLQVPLRIIGVIGKLYVVLESDRGLVLLDQHAAHERILFEQMLNRLEQGNAPSQGLLLPETVELSPKDAQFLKEQLPVLSRLGVALSEFGDRTFLLEGLPPFVKSPDSRAFVIGLIDELKAAGQEINSWRLGEQVVAKTVCRHAVKANDPLGGPELDGLVRDLRSCTMPYTCPHGRPTLIEMNFRELEKKFGRIQ